MQQLVQQGLFVYLVFATIGNTNYTNTRRCASCCIIDAQLRCTTQTWRRRSCCCACACAAAPALQAGCIHALAHRTHHIRMLSRAPPRTSPGAAQSRGSCSPPTRPPARAGRNRSASPAGCTRWAACRRTRGRHGAPRQCCMRAMCLRQLLRRRRGRAEQHSAAAAGVAHRLCRRHSPDAVITVTSANCPLCLNCAKPLAKPARGGFGGGPVAAVTGTEVGGRRRDARCFSWWCLL